MGFLEVMKEMMGVTKKNLDEIFQEKYEGI